MHHIPLVKPEFDPKKLCRDFQKIAQSGILTRGPYLEKFEGQLKKYLKIKYVFGVSSCTSALHLALAALDVGQGDEVLVSDFTFPATGNVVIQMGARPVLVDVDMGTWAMDIDDLAKKITPQSKAIMVVHPFGNPANMTEIMQLAKKYKLAVIEDAACALGSKHKNKLLRSKLRSIPDGASLFPNRLHPRSKLRGIQPLENKFCGNWGDIGCFSFHPRKNITTGEGGAIVTDNSRLAQRIEILRNHGGVKKGSFWEYAEAGFNYRLSELSAALGVEQMAKIDKVTRKRQALVKKYRQALIGIPEISFQKINDYDSFNCQSFVVLLDKSIRRDQIVLDLAEKNIEATLGTYALHSQKSFSQFGYKPGNLPNSFQAYKQTLTLPLYSQMTDEEIEHVANNLQFLISNFH